MARNLTEERIRAMIEKKQREEEILRNKLLLLKNAGKPAHDLPGFDAAREAAVIFVRDNKLPWLNFITSLVKMELGDEYIVKISKPRGPRARAEAPPTEESQVPKKARRAA